MTDYDVPVPVGDRILVKVALPDEKALKSDYIIIHDHANDNYNERALLTESTGVVVDLGQVALEAGILSNSDQELKPGHKILFLQNAGVCFKHKVKKDVLYRLIKRGDIMAVIGTEE